ncbi:vitamin B12 dependent-methionine synthase activation domain-containing protein [Candidatus Symbiobacter mobilis]|uniref:vitamin B12 dependent-methionine synthase activation domain-containing protein n=1 Tax=Candidatus Symbiobacter mobilis TaxID=1436290 RepID=UPI001EE65C85|nr:vitamin B12 dependent-methionine synthase activation domain-containing protein [Candidatus Symbiobacter mobilis]
MLRPTSPSRSICPPCWRRSGKRWKVKWPPTSVSGFFLSHPASRYCPVGKIGKDQLQDQATRRAIDVAALRKILASCLS